MKKIFLSLVCVGIIFSISAQEVQQAQVSVPKQEIYAGLGLLNDNQMIAMVGDIIGTIFTLGYLVEPNEYKALTPFIGYRYNFTKRFSLGAMLAYDSNSVKVAKDVNRNETLDEEEMLDKQIVKRHYLTFAVEPKFNYLVKPIFQLYGYLGLGATIINFGNINQFENGEQPKVNANIPHFNLHFTPIGMRFGKEVGGFLEFGYGYKGIFNAGVSYYF